CLDLPCVVCGVLQSLLRILVQTSRGTHYALALVKRTMEETPMKRVMVLRKKSSHLDRWSSRICFARCSWPINSRQFHHGDCVNLGQLNQCLDWKVFVCPMTSVLER